MCKGNTHEHHLAIFAVLIAVTMACGGGGSGGGDSHPNNFVNQTVQDDQTALIVPSRFDDIDLSSYQGRTENATINRENSKVLMSSVLNTILLAEEFNSSLFGAPRPEFETSYEKYKESSLPYLDGENPCSSGEFVIDRSGVNQSTGLGTVIIRFLSCIVDGDTINGTIQAQTLARSLNGSLEKVSIRIDNLTGTAGDEYNGLQGTIVLSRQQNSHEFIKGEANLIFVDSVIGHPVKLENYQFRYTDENIRAGSGVLYHAQFGRVEFHFDDGDKLVVESPQHSSVSLERQWNGGESFLLTLNENVQQDQIHQLEVLISEFDHAALSANESPVIVMDSEEIGIEKSTPIDIIAEKTFDSNIDFLVYDWAIEAPEGCDYTWELRKPTVASFSSACSGRYQFTLSVDDGRGGQVVQEKSLLVYRDLANVEISPDSTESLTLGQSYLATFTYLNPEEGPFSSALGFGPAGMSLQTDDRIHWVADLPMIDKHTQVHYGIQSTNDRDSLTTVSIDVAGYKAPYFYDLNDASSLEYSATDMNQPAPLLDLNSDGSGELVLRNKIWTLKGDQFERQWENPFSQNYSGSYVADLNNDTVDELVFLQGNTPTISVFNAVTKEFLYDISAKCSGLDEVTLSQATQVNDLDNDGIYEVIFSCNNNEVIEIYNAATTEFIWSSAGKPSIHPWSYLYIANIDDDKAKEIITVTNTSISRIKSIYQVAVIDFAHRTRQVINENASIGSIKFTDLNGDGRDELLSMGSESWQLIDPLTFKKGDVFPKLKSWQQVYFANVDGHPGDELIASIYDEACDGSEMSCITVNTFDGEQVVETYRAEFAERYLSVNAAVGYGDIDHTGTKKLLLSSHSGGSPYTNLIAIGDHSATKLKLPDEPAMQDTPQVAFRSTLDKRTETPTLTAFELGYNRINRVSIKLDDYSDDVSVVDYGDFNHIDKFFLPRTITSEDLARFFVATNGSQPIYKCLDIDDGTLLGSWQPDFKVDHVDAVQFDGAGPLELLSMNSDQVTIWSVDSDSKQSYSLPKPATALNESYNAPTILTTDIDQDNNLDIFIMPFQYSTDDGYIYHYEWSGSGFSLIQSAKFPKPNTRYVYASDVDGDGKQDLLLESYNGTEFLIVDQNLNLVSHANPEIEFNGLYRDGTDLFVVPHAGGADRIYVVAQDSSDWQDDLYEISPLTGNIISRFPALLLGMDSADIMSFDNDDGRQRMVISSNEGIYITP